MKACFKLFLRVFIVLGSVVIATNAQRSVVPPSSSSSSIEEDSGATPEAKVVVAGSESSDVAAAYGYEAEDTHGRSLVTDYSVARGFTNPSESRTFSVTGLVQASRSDAIVLINRSAPQAFVNIERPPINVALRLRQVSSSVNCIRPIPLGFACVVAVINLTGDRNAVNNLLLQYARKSPRKFGSELAKLGISNRGTWSFARTIGPGGPSKKTARGGYGGRGGYYGRSTAQCTDDPFHKFYHTNKNGAQKLKGGCEFVAKKRKKRCRRTMPDGFKVKDSCPATCVRSGSSKCKRCVQKEDAALTAQAFMDSVIRISDAYRAEGGGDANLISDVLFGNTDNQKGCIAAYEEATAALDAAYGYAIGPVLFKPTLSAAPFTYRNERLGALSYFIGTECLLLGSSVFLASYPPLPYEVVDGEIRSVFQEYGFGLNNKPDGNGNFGQGWMKAFQQDFEYMTYEQSLVFCDTAISMGRMCFQPNGGDDLSPSCVDKSFSFKKSTKKDAPLPVVLSSHHSSQSVTGDDSLVVCQDDIDGYFEPSVLIPDVNECPSPIGIQNRSLRSPDTDPLGRSTPRALADDETFCSTEVFKCVDGTYVSRDPANDCKFEECTVDNRASRGGSVYIMNAGRECVKEADAYATVQAFIETVIAISNAYFSEGGGDAKAIEDVIGGDNSNQAGCDAAYYEATRALEIAYGYAYGDVLFKPTFTAVGHTYRNDYYGALSYFIGTECLYLSTDTPFPSDNPDLFSVKNGGSKKAVFQEYGFGLHNAPSVNGDDNLYSQGWNSTFSQEFTYIAYEGTEETQPFCQTALAIGRICFEPNDPAGLDLDPSCVDKTFTFKKSFNPKELAAVLTSHHSSSSVTGDASLVECQNDPSGFEPQSILPTVEQCVSTVVPDGPNGLSPLLLTNFLFSPDPDCDINTNAYTFESTSSSLLQNAVDGQNDYYGLLYRNRYDGEVPCSLMNPDNVAAGLCYDDSQGSQNCNNNGVCGVCASFLHNDIITPNQIYILTEGQYTPTVGYALVENWSMNDGPIEGFAYYPTDSNSVDQRDYAAYDLEPGKGCHVDDPENPDRSQNFVCGDWDGSGNTDVCATNESNSGVFCQCNYNTYDPSDWGWMVANSFTTDHNPDKTGLPEDFFDGCASMDEKQVSYMGMDYSSCWVEENDFRLAGGNLDLIIKAQNSLYFNRDQWWDNENDKFYDANNPDSNYQGWNEVSINLNVDDASQYPKFEALVVALPTDVETICGMSKDVAQGIDDKLYQYWLDGYTTSPVVVMSNVDYDGNGNYNKKFFAQKYYFESGSCIIDPNRDEDHVYYYLADDEDPNGEKYCENY